VAEEHLKKFNDGATLKLFGQELEDETYAICKADMLIRGQDPANIANGDTLAMDMHPSRTLEYQAANPPYGVEWKPAESAVRKEHTHGAAGRFAPGLPAIRDGQMLFSLHLLSKMQPFVAGKGGGRIGVVHNGSPLFTGDAGSGESEIRRHILTNDYLDCIVAMPTDMFYNTNITTYLWFMSNRKPKARKGRVLLIDATGMSQLMKKNLGKKRREFTADCVELIARAYADFKTMDWKDDASNRVLKTKVLDRDHFFYRKVTIERPLRLRFEVTGERLTEFRNDVQSTKAPGKLQLDHALDRLCFIDDPRIWKNAEDFRHALKFSAQTDNERIGYSLPKLKAKDFEIARKFFGTRDKTADPCTNEKGEVLSDSELRDAEYVPLHEDIDSYFVREVLPHWSDAWINTEVKDERDGLIGVVGTEINFNREFYVYTPPRSRAVIQGDIETMEKRFMDMLRGVSK
jgi:type I restriction enzyme M protein